ncbi:aspartate-semialdehyde dehydrogenase [Marinicella sp. S1101]|uniref:aspartate-semialdehyde dehydrogenase n=1 Tax=Marinicella marina TaxID=2996016 RepID=UPI002260C41D|nr:aspartate-semialdehyde dehydrogenase [Marinicella marina]MCX7554439.1 aspartate-semialdehyde dehydrogenase [Marinicella marina]MDJ1140590.1 aspartate-semialdehyde dehydrogenase [Marinicella marina]
MTKKYNVAVVGATGAVGKTMLEILQERQFPIANLYPLASEKSAGELIDFNNKQVRVGNLAEFDFKQADLALFSAGGSVSAHYAPIAANAKCVVIDNTSYFRNEEDVPLVVTEVNANAIESYQNTYIIANPNCSTMQMLVALAPIHSKVGIERINVATYQSVSGAGNKGIDELSEQTRSILNFKPLKTQAFSQQIAFNVIPQIDQFQDNGYTREEMKMVWETQKILGDRSIQVNPTCVRVPVFYGHAEAVHIETREKITADEVKHLMQNAPGVELLDDPASLGFPTPAVHSAGNDAVYVGRIREDISYENGINLWIVSDNIRKGAALNSVQIAEELIKILDKRVS